MTDFASLFRVRFHIAIRTFICASLLCGTAGLELPVACATNYTLTHLNSNFKIDTSSQTIGYEWNVDNRQHLNELSNWFRVGNAAIQPVTDPNGLNGLIKTGEMLIGTNQLLVNWADPSGRFELDIEFTVIGNAHGSGLSTFGESIKITNTSQSPLEFHFYEYIDLDLDQSPNDDTLLVTSQNTLSQTDPQTIFTAGFDVDRYELGYVSTTRDKLVAGTPINLNSVWPAGVGPFGPPGNVAWALQWDFVGTFGPRPQILPGEFATISKICELQMLDVPEPATWTLAVLGLSILWVARRRSLSA